MIVSTVMMTSAMIIVMLRCASLCCDVFYFNFPMTCFCIKFVKYTRVHVYAEVVYGVVE